MNGPRSGGRLPLLSHLALLPYLALLSHLAVFALGFGLAMAPAALSLRPAWAPVAVLLAACLAGFTHALRLGRPPQRGESIALALGSALILLAWQLPALKAQYDAAGDPGLLPLLLASAGLKTLLAAGLLLFAYRVLVPILAREVRWGLLPLAGYGFVLFHLLAGQAAPERIDPAAAPYLDGIRAGIERELAVSDLTCVFAGPFPLDTADRHRLPCPRCAALHAAGLLDRTPVGEPRAKTGRQDYLYRLTAFGRSVYAEDEEADSGMRRPRFCFGRVRVQRITEALAPLRVGNVFVGVRYVAMVPNPHPFLFDARSAALGLSVPDRGPPALYPPRVTTASLMPDGRFLETDGTMRYGRFLNEP